MEKDILIVDHVSLIREREKNHNIQYDLIMKLGKRLRVRQIRKTKIKCLFDL